MKQAWLIVALAVQVALIALVWGVEWGDEGELAAFLEFDAATVDAITVAGEEGTVALARSDDAWQLANGLPADAGKIDRVLEKLAGAAGGWPVATTESAMVRFEVAESAHQRRITLGTGEDIVADIYLGTSPGYQKTHARHVSGGEAYAIEFANYEAGLDASDWLKKSLLQPAGELQSVTRQGDEPWTLTATEDGWIAPDTVLDQGQVATLVGRFEGLTVLDIAAAEQPAAPVLRFLTVDDDGEHELAFHRLEEEGDYIAVSSRFAERFEVATYVVEQLDKALADLVAADGDMTEGEPADADAAEVEATEGDTLEGATTDAETVAGAAAAAEAIEDETIDAEPALGGERSDDAPAPAADAAEPAVPAEGDASAGSA